MNVEVETLSSTLLNEFKKIELLFLKLFEVSTGRDTG